MSSESKIAFWRNAGIAFTSKFALPVTPMVIDPPGGNAGVGDGETCGVAAGAGMVVAPGRVATAVGVASVGIGTGAQEVKNQVASAATRKNATERFRAVILGVF